MLTCQFSLTPDFRDAFTCSLTTVPAHMNQVIIGVVFDMMIA